MASFIARRLFQSIFVLFLVSIIVFTILHLLPGDPVTVMLGDEATTDEIEALKEELGLDRPIYIQYFNWIGNIVQLDFGKSIAYSEEVTSLIKERLPRTVLLGFLAFTVSALIGIPAGVIAAIKRGSFVDSAITVTANLGMATPAFWLAIMSVYLFSLQLGWLPVQGYISPLDDFASSVHHMILPVIFLSLTTVASLARQTRSAMLEVIRQDFVRTARSKGQKERIVVYKHALRNALIPLITLLGLELGHLVGGSVIIEKVFNIPGMGTLILNSIFNQDYIVVQSCVMIIAIIITVTNLLVDIAYGYVDPRIRYR